VPDTEFVGEHRDFIVSCFARQEHIADVNLTAWDGAHSALLARMHALAPAQGNVVSTAASQADLGAQAVVAGADRDRYALVYTL